MTTRARAPRRVAVVLLVGATALVSGCTSAADQAASGLDDRLAGAHEVALRERAADPTGVDAAAADRLAEALTGGNVADLVSSTVSPDGVEVVTTAGVRAQTGGGLSYEDATLGACVRTRATAGSRTGDVGERGTVSTEAVPCPDGVVPTADSAPVEATTTDVEALVSPVPRAVSPPCLSGSGDCGGGG